MRKPAEPKAANSETELVADSAPLARTRSARGTIVGRNALSAASKKVVSTAVSSVTSSNSGSDSQPPSHASGISPSSAARPRSAQIITGRRRSLSTQAPATTRRPARRRAHGAHEGNAHEIGVQVHDGDERQGDTRHQRAKDRDACRRPDAPERTVAPQAWAGSLVGRREFGVKQGLSGHHGRVGLPSQAVFDDLSERLRGVLGRLTGRGRITEADVDAAMREVRLALLEADVNFAWSRTSSSACASRRSGPRCSRPRPASW